MSRKSNQFKTDELEKKWKNRRQKLQISWPGCHNGDGSLSIMMRGLGWDYLIFVLRNSIMEFDTISPQIMLTGTQIA